MPSMSETQRTAHAGAVAREMLNAIMRPGPVRRTAVVATLATLALLILVWEPQSDLSPAGQRTLAIFVVALGLWVSKALPLMVTSMLAIILFPLLGVCPAKEAFSHFGNPAVFFILGTFILSAGLTETGLARRLALSIVRAAGDSATALVTALYGFGLVACCFVSEHAVVALQLPIVLELVRLPQPDGYDRRFGRALFLAMAWGCIIGGVTTFLGGARAPLAIGILDEGWGQTISFGRFTAYSLPIMLPLAVIGLLMLRRLTRGVRVDLAAGQALLSREIGEMGAVSRRELGMAALLLVTIIAWISTDPQWLAVIALLATSVAFGFELISWKEVQAHVDWGLILMYGGAIVLGRMVVETGLGAWAGGLMLDWLHAVGGADYFSGLVTTIALFLTEGISNTAVVAASLPVAIPLGIDLGLAPELITVLVTLASGFAFCLPMGTPATALALAGGHVRPMELIRYGLVLKLAALAALLLAPGMIWARLGLG